MDTVAQKYEAFAVLARSYCDLIVDESLNGWVGLKEIHRRLIHLHAAAMELPEIELPDDEDPHLAHRRIAHDEAQMLYQTLQTRLPFDHYWDTFNPLEKQTDMPYTSSLADDLVDIWRDLENGLLAIEAGPPHLGVWWEWRFSFHSHWGQHSSGALRTLYFALRNND